MALRACLAVLFSALLVAQASAQSASGAVGLDAAAASPAQGQQPATGGQHPAKPEGPRYPNLLDGSLSALGDLEADYAPATGRWRVGLDNYFAWKQRLADESGFAFSASWGVLWQNYSNSAGPQPNAVGSKVAINLAYDLFKHNEPDAFSIDMAVEDRRPIGTDLTPLHAGIDAGSIVPTAPTWSQFDLGITQFYVRQNLLDNRFQYAIGKLLAPNYIDAYPFFDDNRQFLSQQFSTSTTCNCPLWGFGAVAAWFPTSGGSYLKGGMFTSNSSATGSTIGDFFTKSEHFYMFEAGLSSLAGAGAAIHARGPTDLDNIHLTGWYRDATSTDPDSYGVLFNANYTIDRSILLFLRGGWSKNFTNEGTVAVGFGWRPPNYRSELLGVGFGWTHPSDSALRSQYVLEGFYRFQLLRNFALTPDVQLVINPSLNSTVDAMVVFSLRARIVF